MAWPYAIDWELTLKYVQTYLSWPVLASAFAILFVKLFKSDISTFLGNVRPKAPVFEPAVFLPQPVDPPPAPSDDPITRHDPVDVPMAAEAAPDAEAVAQAEKEEHFRYLNHLLVYTSQMVLALLAPPGKLTTKQLIAYFPKMDAENRQATLTVLYQHGLIRIDEGGVAITEKGLEYVRWPERIAWVNVMSQNVLADATVRMTNPSGMTRNALTGEFLRRSRNAQFHGQGHHKSTVREDFSVEDPHDNLPRSKKPKDPE